MRLFVVDPARTIFVVRSCEQAITTFAELIGIEFWMVKLD